MKKEDEQAEYIPFGEEWEKEMNKLSKKELIVLFRNLAIENQKQHEQIMNNMFKNF